MKTIEKLFENEGLSDKIKERIDRLANKIGGKVVLFDTHQIIFESRNKDGVSSLMALSDRVGEKLESEWNEFSQALVSKKRPFFLEDIHGLIVFWMPIMEEDKYLGGLLGHGGFLGDAQNEEEKHLKKEKLYYALNLPEEKITWEKFNETISEFKFIDLTNLTSEVASLAVLLNVLITENISVNA